MKKLYLTLFIILVLVSFLTASLVEMENKFIKLIGDPETGRFILKTTDGDPKLDTDQNALLLYEDYPPTSFTTVQIDGREYKFGDEVGTFITRMLKRDDKMICVWSLKNIEVSQNLRFVKGPTTDNPDTIEVSYTVWNKDTREHTIGIRIMLDTYLGKEDGAPFRIPALGSITEEKELSGSQLPEYWYSYDDLSEPTVRAQGTLRIEGSPLPEKIIYASWERFNKYLWDFPIKEGRSFRRSIIGPPDSAVAIFWEPKKYNPNDTYSLKTYYGLYGATLYKGRVFNVSLGGPVTTEGDPVLITADVQNITTDTAKDVNAEIILPEGLVLEQGEKGTKSMASLKSREIKKTQWNITPDGTTTGIVVYKVKVTGTVKGKLETEIVERKLNIKGEKKVTVTATKTYSLYDFSELNKLIKEMNGLLNKNNDKVDELNTLIQKKGPYSKDQAKQDRSGIQNRVESSKDVETRLPDATKSVIKEIKK
ncbi:MAG: hypothetical protein JW827_10235 [Spirochaetes bacterium]|nr:hypothetical protein [Spirochaetota bacterium]